MKVATLGNLAPQHLGQLRQEDATVPAFALVLGGLAVGVGIWWLWQQRAR